CRISQLRSKLTKPVKPCQTSSARILASVPPLTLPAWLPSCRLTTQQTSQVRSLVSVATVCRFGVTQNQLLPNTLKAVGTTKHSRPTVARSLKTTCKTSAKKCQNCRQTCSQRPRWYLWQSTYPTLMSP